MGTWNTGLLDNDTALDGLGELNREVVEDIVRFGGMRPSRASTDKLAAAVGVLLQLSSYDFKTDEDHGRAIVAAVKRHAGEIAHLPRAARAILDAVAEGKGEALAERPAKMSAKAIAALHAHASKAPFGKREPSLFASKAGAAYVQLVAKRAVAMIDSDFEDADNWSDLAREGLGLGCLGALLVLDPCRIPAAKLARWRRSAKKGLATLEAAKDHELHFHRPYYAALDVVLVLLQKRQARQE